MTNKEQILTALGILKEVLTVHKRQQRELLAYQTAFLTFNKISSESPHLKELQEYANTLNGLVESARQSPALEDKSLVQAEEALGKWSQTVSESVLDSELSELLGSIKQGLPN